MLEMVILYMYAETLKLILVKIVTMRLCLTMLIHLSQGSLTFKKLAPTKFFDLRVFNAMFTYIGTKSHNLSNKYSFHETISSDFSWDFKRQDKTQNQSVQSSVPSSLPSRVNKKNWEEHYLQFQMFLKTLDQSSLKDHFQTVELSMSLNWKSQQSSFLWNKVTHLLFVQCTYLFCKLMWGRVPPKVRTAIPIDGQFKHFVLSCTAVSDHGIVWIEREAEKALQVQGASPIIWHRYKLFANTLEVLSQIQHLQCLLWPPVETNHRNCPHNIIDPLTKRP
ncbi:hypothetical protein Cgig2_029434 [Carnegiea gigantea]|uniref:Uncharacterized protein n=1 Tax=Carnegiea gigantea TaxID=171969 RepID=A0A9Q1GM85_9CARY|nr:hypothetical protein Cgig2_029434 [Carnegiea gigantea]